MTGFNTFLPAYHKPARFLPFAAWAGQVAVSRKYPTGKPTHYGRLREFHHSGHAHGVLYWWQRGAQCAKGPQVSPLQQLAARVWPKWSQELTVGFGRKTEGVTSPPISVKNCLYVKTKSGHTIVSDAIYAEWCYP